MNETYAFKCNNNRDIQRYRRILDSTLFDVNTREKAFWCRSRPSIRNSPWSWFMIPWNGHPYCLTSNRLEDLPLEAQLNAICDSNANGVQKKLIPSHFSCPPYKGSKSMLRLNQHWITSNYEKKSLRHWPNHYIRNTPTNSDGVGMVNCICQSDGNTSN